MKKFAVSLVLAVFALGASGLACNSGRPWMSFLPLEDQIAIAEAWAAQAAASEAPVLPAEEQVPPPPPPPLFVQADPLTPPSLASESGDAYPAQAAPIEMEDVVVIS